VLEKCVGNAVQIQDSNENIKVSKKYATDSKRIDLLAAILNAMVRIQSLRDVKLAGVKVGVLMAGMKRVKDKCVARKATKGTKEEQRKNYIKVKTRKWKGGYSQRSRVRSSSWHGIDLV
jgi:phage terminase large subunit-like protein